VPAFGEELATAVQDNQTDDAPMDCAEGPLGVWCQFDNACFEYAGAFEVYFVPCDAGVCIDGIGIHAGGSYSQDKQKADRESFERYLRASRGKPCAP
jgi:hypothetical protein